MKFKPIEVFWSCVAVIALLLFALVYYEFAAEESGPRGYYSDNAPETSI